MTVERSFDPTDAAVGAARRFVLGEIGAVSKARLDALAVMVSELASNAVLHARTEFRVRVERFPGAVRVEVIDSDSGLPVPQLEPSLDAPHGRGLFTVQRLAEEWGVTTARDGGEKSVWFRLSVEEPAVSSSP